ncbi:MAG TPA: RES domain-containing protein [Acidobacteriaceae bacterium]|jgi:RES domain-containing protein
MLIAYRIADGRFPIYDGTGAMLHGGRWNSPGQPVIYAAETFAGAMLEVLVHANLSHIPRTHRSVRIEIPESLVETVNAAEVPGWEKQDLLASRAFGDRWLKEGRSAVLLVPGVATAGREHNVLIDPRHPEFAHIQVSAPEPVAWDARLFAR